MKTKIEFTDLKISALAVWIADWFKIPGSVGHQKMFEDLKRRIQSWIDIQPDTRDY